MYQIMALGINPSLESGVRGYTCRTKMFYFSILLSRFILDPIKASRNTLLHLTSLSMAWSWSSVTAPSLTGQNTDLFFSARSVFGFFISAISFPRERLTDRLSCQWHCWSNRPYYHYKTEPTQSRITLRCQKIREK